MSNERTEALSNLRLYTLTELEPIIGVSHLTLLRWLKDGKLKATKIGRKWRVSEENLRAFVNGEPQK